MAKKFYAVKAGRVPGVYGTWRECQAQINGFSGAVFKSFTTEEEAAWFVGVSAPGKGREDTQAIAYVDGSYDDQCGAFSCGVVLFCGGEEIHLTQKFTDTELLDMRNVAGEIKGTELAMQYCLDHQIESITIYHDYEGIARWCTGDWAAKRKGTAAYVDFYRRVCHSLRVQFVKVKGHSGDTYNDLADRLAKAALRG